MDNEEIVVQQEEAPQEEAPKKKRPGRKPMTPEQKEAARKAREEKKKLEKQEEQRKLAEGLQPEIYVQYQQTEANVTELIQVAKDEFHKEKKRTHVTSMKLYVKPEERTVYYVINDSAEGKVEY